MNDRILKIIEKAKEYAQKNHIADKEALAFIAGAVWADETPMWISMDDKQPEARPNADHSFPVVCISKRYDAIRHLKVVTVSSGIYFPLTGFWIFDGARILEPNEKVLYWMEMKLPKGLI